MCLAGVGGGGAAAQTMTTAMTTAMETAMEMAGRRGLAGGGGAGLGLA